MKKKNGFTLLELLICVTLLSVVIFICGNSILIQTYK